MHLIQPFRAHPETGHIPDQDLHSISVLPNEHESVTSKWIFPQLVGHQRRQRVERLPHVHRRTGEENPLSRSKRQHGASIANARATERSNTGS
jgi:hypothetical protein